MAYAFASKLSISGVLQLSSLNSTILKMNRICSSCVTPRIFSCYSTKSALSPSSSKSFNPPSVYNLKPMLNPLYSFLPETQNPNNLVNLIFSALKQPNFQTNHLHDLIPHLGTQEISRVLLRCQCESQSALIFFNWVKNDLGLNPTPLNYCILVNILVWSRNFVQGMKFLSELIHLESGDSERIDIFQGLVSCSEDCNWDPVVFDMLIKAYVKDGMIKEGYRVFKKMVKMGFVPHVLAFNCLLNGLSKENYIDKCWELYKEMWRIGINPNTCTFNIFTHVMCKNRNVDKVNEFLEKMEEEGFEPDLVTYNTLIGSYCRNRRLEDAFYLYKIMYRRGVVPDLYTYTSLMNGLCKIGKLKEAHEIFHRMVDRGLTPDIVSYNSLIHGYCREGKMKKLRLLVHDMMGKGIFPDNFTCQVIVEGYVKVGSWHSCLNMVVELKRFGVPISFDIYKYLIISLSQENRPFAAVKLLDRMLEDGHESDKEMYDKLVKSFCDNDHVEEALLHKTKMLERRVKPCLAIYQNLISCLCRLGRCLEAEALMQEMVIYDLKPDYIICRALVSAYCNAKNSDRAESLLFSLAMKYQLYDTDSYNTLLKTRSEQNSAIELMELQDKMLKLGFAPNGLTCKYVLQGLQNAVIKDNGNFKSAISKVRLIDQDVQRCLLI